MWHRWLGRQVLPPVVGAIGAVTFPAHAQEQSSATRAGFFLQPSVSVSETYTNNVRLDRGSDARSDLITDISPALRLSSRSGRIIGDVDYALHGLLYARQSSADEVQQSLSARGTAEAIENWAYVDASASIGQQSISALGRRSSDNSLANSNRAEVSSYQISPYVKGRLGSLANYVARWNWTASNSGGSSAKSNANEASLGINSSAETFSRLGWSLNASQQTSDFGNQPSQESSRFNGGLNFAVTPEFRVSAGGGTERNDYQTLNQKSYTTWSTGFTWVPSQRTRLEVTREHRFFGAAYNIRFEYRTPRTVWTFTDGQDVSTNSSANGTNGSLSVFDLLYAQFASIVPDPTQRAALVDAFLRNNGLTRNTLATGGFLTNAPSIQRRQNFSAAFLGVRTTVLLSTSRNDARAANPTNVSAGDLSNGRNLHSTAFGINLSHRLTPLSALSADVSVSKNSSTVDNRSTNLRSLVTTYTRQLGKQVDLSLSARRTLFRSDTDPYNESALTASLRLRF